MNTPTLPSLSLPAVLLNKLAYHEHSMSIESNSSKTYLHKNKGMHIYHRAEILCKQKNILQISGAHDLRYACKVETFLNLPSYVNQVES
uniref:Uncharacterized protein n=1 Tax=Glossina palpalis gambiensis TaxID=67801 RepID=A0A1B0BX19_9MUSC